MGQRNFQLPGTMSETQVIASVELLTDQIQILLAERDHLAQEVERKDKVLYYIYDGFGEDNWITLAIYKVLHPEKPLQYDGVDLVPLAPQRKFIGLSGVSEPCEPGSFVGDIYYGDPINTTMGTHRWLGAEWVATSEGPPPAPGVAMSGWRTDMENAPDDGTPVLLGVWDLGPDMATAAWNGAFWDMRFLDGEDIETVTTDRYNREFANPAAWLPLDALPPPPVSP